MIMILDGIDFRPTAVPIWMQIETAIREQIASRRFRAGDAVPSVRELARSLAVTPNTVERAYQRLIALGVLTPRRGRGTFVSEKLKSFASEREQLLEQAASSFAAMASDVGAPLAEATRELAAAYRRLDATSAAAK